jgi:hypothetical protein
MTRKTGFAIACSPRPPDIQFITIILESADIG